ncbi:MAG: HAD family hydrolase, partial [Angelakisella sp.]
MIKLVISDVDGTLIDESEVLSHKAIEMAEYLRERNVLFTIATGRVEYIAEGFVKKLGITIPYITCNGATIVNGKEILERNQIALSPLRYIIEKADSEGLSIVYSINGYEKVYRFTPWVLDQQRDFDRYHEEHRFSEEEWQTLLVDKITIMDDTLAGCIAQYDKLCAGLPEGYGYTRYLDRAVEIVSGGA